MFITKFKKLTFILFLFLPIFISAQTDKNFYFENISIPDGLSNTQVWDIVQDKYGFLWIATFDGLNRYDGYDIKVFKNDPEDKGSISNNKIQSLLIDKNNNLFIGTNSGLSIYNNVSETFSSYLPDSSSANSPANNILRISEDSKSRIWVSTGAGISLFNPRSFKFESTYLKNGDKKTPNSGTTFSFLETSSGDIYSGYLFSGLIKYNENEKLFEKIVLDSTNENGFAQNLIFNLFEDKTGKLWICSNNGLFTYDPHSTVFAKLKLFESSKTENNESSVLDIYQDESGFLWIATAIQGLFRYNLRSNTFTKIGQNSFPSGVSANDPFFKFFKDDFGVLWIATFNKGLLKLDFQKEPFKLYPKPGGNSNSSFTSFVSSIFKSDYKDDFVWLGTFDGLFKYNLITKTSESFTYKKGNSNSLPSNNVFSIVQGDNSGLWIGTGNGLSYFNTSINSFTNYDLIEKTKHNEVNYNSIRDISIDDYGNLWLATGNGVVKFDTKSKIKSFIRQKDKKTYNNKLLSIVDSLHNQKKYISSILQVGDYQNLTKDFEIKKKTNVLIVSVGEGLGGMFDYGWLKDSRNNTLFIHKDSLEVFNYFSGINKNRILIKSIALNPGKYILGYVSDDSHSYGKWNAAAPIDSTWWGIQVFEIPDNSLMIVNELLEEDKNQQVIEGTSARVVKYQKDGSLLIGTDEGLSKFYISQNRIEKIIYPSSIPINNNTKTIRDIFIDSDGIVWLATMGGLIRYDQKLNQFGILYDKDGLPSNYLEAIQEDSYNNLWISTLNGITKFNKNIKNPIFINYDIKDGLQSYDFFERSSFKSSNGELFFGGTNGFNSFLSGNINKQLPRINIAELKINNKIVVPDAEGSPLTKNILDTKDIVLNYSQNNISFDFNSIHYSRPDKNMNAYMLEGFDKEGWIYTERKFATYTNLSEGDYTFKVKGSNGDGIWNEAGVSLHIKILPPWWRTIWAYLGYGLLFIGIIFGIDRIQRRRLLKRARETARIREAEVRAQIAESESERKTKELEEARKLQLSMLPKELPNLPHLDIAVYMKTATEVGGDYYDFHIGLDGVLTVVIGDATGHGLNAGTMVTSTKSLFNALAPNPNIIETFHEMTRCLKLMRLEKLSMCMAMLKIMGNKLVMSSAGMPPVFLYRKETDSVEEHIMKGMPLGTFPEFPYTLKETLLNVGDTILLMSDGFPELFNEQKEMYGYKRARRLFEEIGDCEPEDIITKLKDEGSSWVNDKDPDDDVTFVVIKVK